MNKIKFKLHEVNKYPTQINPTRPPGPSRPTRYNSFGNRIVTKANCTVYLHSIRPLDISEIVSISIIEMENQNSKTLINFNDGSQLEL